MIKITPHQLWLFLSDHHEKLGVDLVEMLKGADLKVVVADSNMSENHLGGDNVVEYVEEAVAAVRAGYSVFTWYGDDTEALVVGIKPGQIDISDFHAAEQQAPADIDDVRASDRFVQ